MRLYFRRYFDHDKHRVPKTAGRRCPGKIDVEHLINQTIIWIVIIFLLVFIVKKLFQP